MAVQDDETGTTTSPDDSLEETNESSAEEEQTTCSDSSSSNSPQQRTLPSRSNRGARMRLLLGNAHLITESKADKGYKRLFSDGNTSDSMNDSEEYSSASDDASDSFDSDFDDEAQGKLVSHGVSEDESGESDHEKSGKRLRKAPKQFRGGRTKPTASATPKRVEIRALTTHEDPADASPQNTLAVQESRTRGKGRPKRTETIDFSRPVKESPQRAWRRPANTQPGKTQAERMEHAMRIREENLALAASGVSWNDENATPAQPSAKSLREKFPFFFYDTSGYRTIERAEWRKKYDTTTLYMFPMCGAEYESLFATSVPRSAPTIQALSQQRLERCPTDVADSAPPDSTPPSRYAYRYSNGSTSNAGARQETHAAALVPYPLLPRQAGRSPKSSKTPKGGMSAKGGHIIFGKNTSGPDSAMFGCRGPYREPYTGIFYSNQSQYERIKHAVGTIQSFWEAQGYPAEWRAAWGTMEEFNKRRPLRYALMPFLVDAVCRGEAMVGG